MSQSFQFVYSNCKFCHSEVYIGDLIEKACPSCNRDPHLNDRYKCTICKYSCNTLREINRHYSDNQHKKNLILIKQWLFQ